MSPVVDCALNFRRLTRRDTAVPWWQRLVNLQISWWHGQVPWCTHCARTDNSRSKSLPGKHKGAADPLFPSPQLLPTEKYKTFKSKAPLFTTITVWLQMFYVPCSSYKPLLTLCNNCLLFTQEPSLCCYLHSGLCCFDHWAIFNKCLPRWVVISRTVPFLRSWLISKIAVETF